MPRFTSLKDYLYDLSSKDTLQLVCYARSQPPGKNVVEKSRDEGYSINENHNLERALKHFSKVVKKQVSDNRIRSIDIAKVIDRFHKNII